MKKNIALFISTLNSGGAERVVSHLSKILSTDYNVHVVLYETTCIEYEFDGYLCDLNVPATKGGIFAKLKLLFKRVKKLKQLIKKEKIECVISFLDSPNIVNLLAKCSGCKKIVSIRNYSKRENKKSLLGYLTDFFIRKLYKRADYVVAVSELIKNSYVKDYKIPKEKVVTIYNPYNFEDIKEKANQSLTKEESNFYNQGFSFVNVGRIMYQKGIWHLLKAFYLVNKQSEDARLVLVGEDLSNGQVKKFLEESKLADKVLLVGRTRNPYQYMANSQCYVLSSLFEGFPNAMVEAMVCGCPIISADCKSGPREILFNNADLGLEITSNTLADYGVLVPDLEAEENWNLTIITDGEKRLAQAMLHVMNDKKQIRELSKLSKVRSSMFGFDKCKEEYLKIINN